VTPESEATSRFLEDFKTRHATSDVLEGLSAVRPLKILVIGEAIVDEYSYCTPLGKAPKDPIISAKHVRLERHAGGVLACANHVAGFCDEVHLLTCLGGDDSQEAFIRERLRPNVAPRFLVREGAPVITKRRYVTEGALLKMFEVITMDDSPLPRDVEDQMLDHLDRTLPTYDVVIVADYGHGLLGPRTVGLLAERARFLAVNTQANPGNIGFNVVTKYPRAGYVCLDEQEARLAMRDRWTPAPELVMAVRRLLKARAVSVTQGAHGVLVSGPDEAQRRIPALSAAVVDKMGAGDAYFAITAPCVAAGMPMEVVGLLGSAAAALAVGFVGNRSFVDRPSVESFVHALLT
jgi:bifunctional ADP-heptose synthase (sugar kinase/adenylyltransferase)